VCPVEVIVGWTADLVFAMIPPDLAPAPGLPDQKRTIAAIREALEQANPGKAVFLSSIGSEQPSGLGLITSTHLMEEAMRTLPIPVVYLRAGKRRSDLAKHWNLTMGVKLEHLEHYSA
jgi:hypothetical protein